jgi:Fe-S oxidoreductase
MYDEPREIVDRNGRVDEPARSRERSFCCGAGGGRMFLGEEEGKRVNVERAEQLIGTGAGTVGAACPFCNSMFRAAFSETANAPKLVDIAQIAAAQLPKQPT